MATIGLVATTVLGMLAASLSGVDVQPEGVEPEPADDPTATASADFGSTGGVQMDAGTDESADAEADTTFEAESGASSSSTTTTTTSSADDSAVMVAPEPVVTSGGGIDPFKGRLAVGAIRTIAGLNGINVRYFVSDKLVVGATAGVALFAYKENDPASDDTCPGDDCTFEDNRTVVGMGFGAEALYFAHLGREAGQLPFRADFGIGGRFGILSLVNDNDAADDLDDPLEFHIEVPLVFQLMFGNNFTLAPELGMDFRIVPGSREAGDTNPGFGPPPSGLSGPGFGWDLTPGIGLFAGASMHYVFGARS